MHFKGTHIFILTLKAIAHGVCVNSNLVLTWTRQRAEAGGRERMREPQPKGQPRSPNPPGVLCRWPSLPGYVDTLALSAAVAGPLILYILTMPRTAALEDDGWFLIVGNFLGVGHPPGYPVHTLISNLFLKLPWGSPAFLGHLLSAVFGAFACGAVYVCARLLGAAVVAAITSAWLFAVSEHFWAQAIITEVYTLNALCFFGIFALLLHLRRNPDDRRAWAGAAFLYGISLANHWPLMVLASPGLLLAVVPLWRNFIRRLPLLVGSFLPAVLLPYAWMVWHSLREPTFSFPGPLRTLEDIVAHVTRETYSGVDSSVSAGWSDRFEFLQWFGGEIVWQLTLPGFLLALVGFAVLLAPPPQKRRGQARTDDLLDWAGRSAGFVAFFGQSVLLLWLIDFDYDFFHVQVFRPYSLVCYGLLAIWAAVGLTYAIPWAGRRLFRPALMHPLLLAGTVAAVGLAMTGWSAAAHWDANNRAGADFAQRYADMVFDILPTDAVLMTSGDEITLPLGYYHFVEGQRPDMRLVEMNGVAFPGNLYPAVPRTTSELQQRALREFITETDHPVFHTYRTHRIDHGKNVRDYGFFREVLTGNSPLGSIELRPRDEAEAYFASLFTQEYRNGWELVARSHQIIDYGQYLGFAVLSGNPELIERTAPLRELAEQDYYGLNGMASTLAKFGNAEYLEQAITWLEMAENLHDAALTKQAEIAIYNNMGTVRWRQGRTDAAISFFEVSRDIMPHPDNPGVQYLQQLNR